MYKDILSPKALHLWHIVIDTKDKHVFFYIFKLLLTSKYRTFILTLFINQIDIS